MLARYLHRPVVFWRRERRSPLLDKDDPVMLQQCVPALSARGITSVIDIADVGAAPGPTYLQVRVLSPNAKLKC